MTSAHAAYVDYALRRTAHLPSEMAGVDGNVRLKDYQLFVARVFLGLDRMHSLLLFHETGVGKTMTAVYVLKHLRDVFTDWTVIVLVKKALVEQPWTYTLMRFAPETVPACTFINYDDPRFHHRFFTVIKTTARSSRLCVVIDEFHNFVSMATTKEDGRQRPARTVYNYLAKNISLANGKMLCLTATPVVNSVKEFTMAVNLLRPGVVGQTALFNGGVLSNPEDLVDKLGGVCSYLVTNEASIFDDVEGSAAFARKRVRMMYVDMTPKQTAAYRRAAVMERKSGAAVFRVYRRAAATFAFEDAPDKSVLSKQEYDEAVAALFADFARTVAGRAFTEAALAQFRRGETPGGDRMTSADVSLLTELRERSCKYTEVCLRILASPGKCLVFEPFVNVTGIEMLLLYFAAFGISAVEFSSRTRDTRDKLVDAFNACDNTDGEKIKVCVFSLSGSEGLSFLSVNDIFILDMTWNEASLRQIVGRAVRLNSHEMTPAERRYVNVHFVIARQDSGAATVDEDLLDIIRDKSRQFAQLFRVLKRASLEWVHAAFTDFAPLVDDAGWLALVSRPADASAQIRAARLADGQSVWYATSTALVTVRKGFLETGGRLFDDDGNFLTTVGASPTVRVSNGRLVYVVDPASIA
ncbi:putative transcription termination factor NPH-I [Parapoxvirus red deer/HL953]|uniref:Nucleoside triphosphatase I n=1 Tax=Parapoxvirus red deer/HL953 TaxID=1579460 RepID=A0A0A7MA94_9POXV|nr:putative transcription termination factor NPH-I [Parapoxvirus red deer/HL953]AIZ77323.1 putative transcription termination factor NPH-I [Parapoxvirus red deer/HL953]